MQITRANGFLIVAFCDQRELNDLRVICRVLRVAFTVLIPSLISTYFSNNVPYLLSCKFTKSDLNFHFSFFTRAQWRLEFHIAFTVVREADKMLRYILFLAFIVRGSLVYKMNELHATDGYFISIYQKIFSSRPFVKRVAARARLTAVDVLTRADLGDCFLHILPSTDLYICVSELEY